MLEIGKTQTLKVVRLTDNGAYLAEEAGAAEDVLLPRRYLTEHAALGDSYTVFLYKDSEDRLIATTETPALELGGLALLTVSQTTKIGAFLNWGLSKELLLPFHETRGELRPGQKVFVTLYVDHTGRLAASMKVDRFFRTDSPYTRDDRVRGHVYGINEKLGAFVAVDDRYYGLIPAQELYEKLKIGQEVEARVTKLRPDGKLNLSLRRKAYKELDGDSALLWEHLEAAGGVLGLGDKSDAVFIKAELSMSKNAFKRAAGHLLKAGKIRIFDDRIERI